MKTTDFIKENFVADAAAAHQDHEVQMARGDCYNAAKYAIELHKLLKNISEQEGLDGWVSEKITLANDYLRTVTEYLRYEQQSSSTSDMPEFNIGAATQTLDAALSEDQATPDTWYLKKDGELITPYTSTKPYTFKSKEEAIAWAKEKFKVSYAQGKIYPEANPGLNLSPTVGPIDSYVGVKEEDEEPQQKRKPAVVKTNKPIGSRVADIGPGGKEYNVKTDKAWDDQHKEVDEERTVTRDETGKIIAWRDESDWRRVDKDKDGRGKVANLSDKARRETEKLQKNQGVDEDKGSLDDNAIWNQYGHYNAQDLMQEFPNISPKDAESIVSNAERGWTDPTYKQKYRDNVVKLVKMAMGQQGVEEGKADPTGSWVVYGGSKVKRFKTRDGAKAYAEKNGGKVASSEFYADNIQNKGVAESAGGMGAGSVATSMGGGNGFANGGPGTITRPRMKKKK